MVHSGIAVPYSLAGMKIGVTMAMIGVIVGEFVTVRGGGLYAAGAAAGGSV